MPGDSPRIIRSRVLTLARGCVGLVGDRLHFYSVVAAAWDQMSDFCRVRDDAPENQRIRGIRT
jgi:hypothetical protein